ncbi:Uncharacterized protein SCF082_LOCUS12940, partial [Durusdinium trenchii]
MDGDTKAIMEKLLAEKIGINKKLQGILSLLTLANYAYGIKLRPSALMVHDKNRGGAMLNAWDVHRKGAAILDAGLQPKLVIPSSICIEMASDGESRKRQLNANQNLAATSSGMLPAPIGDERCLKLGNSHWVMFCKALQAGCVNPKGQQLHTPAELEKLMAEGWERQAISEKVEQPFPSFPSLCQSALNSVNSNATSTGELEAMLQLASYLKSGATLSDAVEAVHAAQPVCGHYLQDIATFVKLYTGGEDFPLLDQLKGEKASFAFGKLSVRLILVLLAKQKRSRDTVEFDSFEEVAQRFTDELTGTATQITLIRSSHSPKLMLIAWCLFDSSIVIHADFHSLKQWKVTKQQPPLLCPVELMKSRTGTSSDSSIYMDMRRGEVQSIVNEAYLQHLPGDQLLFSLHPSNVFCSTKVKKNEINLYPVGVVHMVKPADVPKIKGIHLKYKGFDWTLTPYRSLPAFDDSKAGYLVAYNWVQTAEEEEEANMTVKWLTIRGLSLPVLQNCVPLSKHDAL